MEVGQPEIKDFTGIRKLKGVSVKLREIPNAPSADIRNKEEYPYP